MLKTSTLNTATTLASQLADKGLTLVAKPNTVLNELVALSTLPYEVKLESDEDLYQAFYGLENTSSGTMEDPTQHSLQQDGIIKDLAPIVVGHVSHAKNIVKPIVVEMAKAIEDYLSTFKAKSASDVFEIQCLEVPELAADESFLDTLTPYKGKTILKPDLRFKLATKSSEDLIKLVTFGSDRTDKLILQWVSNLPEDFLVRVFNSFFTIEQIKDIVSYDDIDRANVFEKLDYALAILLLSTKLFDAVDESAKDLDLNVYKNTAAQYRDYAGALVVDCLTKIALFIKTERLVMVSDSKRYIAKVNGAVYRPWLQNGGSPEVILGHVISGDTQSSKSIIDIKSKDYLNAWNSYCTFYNVEQANKTIDFFKQFLVGQFALQLKEVSEAEQAYITKTPNYYSTVNQLATEYIDGLKTNDMKEVYTIALTLVAKIRFGYTSAYNILNDINEAAKANPNVDVREAALLAVINYVTDYFANQISVVSGA